MKIFKTITKFSLCVCACKSHRTTSESWCSPLTIWVSRTELRLLVTVAGVHLLSQLRPTAFFPYVSYCYEMLLSGYNSHDCLNQGNCKAFTFQLHVILPQLYVGSEVPEWRSDWRRAPLMWKSSHRGKTFQLRSCSGVTHAPKRKFISSSSKTCVGIVTLVCHWCSVWGKSIFAHVSSGKVNIIPSINIYPIKIKNLKSKICLLFYWKLQQ